jgi:hypothetical protein
MYLVSSFKFNNRKEKTWANKKSRHVKLSERKDLQHVLEKTYDGWHLRVRLEDSRIPWSKCIEESGERDSDSKHFLLELLFIIMSELVFSKIK